MEKQQLETFSGFFRILRTKLKRRCDGMFLTELQTEERKAFLELAALIAKIDGKISIFENSILIKYQKEMGLEDYKIKSLEIGEILRVFKTERSKNIVLTELLQLIYSDGVFHDQESETIQFIKSYFGFDSSEYGSFKDWIAKIKELTMSKGKH
jgi:tellurite resistance protein